MNLEILKGYQEVANKTAIYPKRHDTSVMLNTGGVIYTALGLCGECGEYLIAYSDFHAGITNDTTKIVQEAGDVCWYLVEFLSELDIPVDVLINSEANNSNTHRVAVLYACDCAELIKKGIRDKGRISSETLKLLIRNLQCIWASMNFDMESINISMEDVLYANNKKLLSRLSRGQLQGSGDDR